MTGGEGFFAMGGYAAYVWSSYGVAAVVLAGLAAIVAVRARARRLELEALRARIGDRGTGEGR